MTGKHCNCTKCGKHAADRALVELQDRGFIVVTKRSGFNLKTRIATEWRLTEFTCDINGTFASKDFTRWSATGAVGGAVKTFHGCCEGTDGCCEGTVRVLRGDRGGKNVTLRVLWGDREGPKLHFTGAVGGHL
jgi:hypothetical protein